MARLQSDDAKMLWDEMGDRRSWDALKKILQKRLEQPKGIENTTVECMLEEIGQFRDSQKFPESPKELVELVNKNMKEDCGKHGHEDRQHEQHQQHKREHQPKQHQPSHQEHKREQQQHSEHSHEQHQKEHQPHHEERRHQQQEPVNKNEQRQLERGEENYAQAPFGQGQPSGMIDQPENMNKQQDMGMTRQGQKMAGSGMQGMEDVEILFARGNWKSWDEMLLWLVQTAPADGVLTEEEIADLEREVQAFRDADVPFLPNQVVEIVRRRRQ